MGISVELVKQKRGDTEQALTEEQLETVLKDAYSIENRAAYGKENREKCLIGTVQRGKRLYDVYQDEDGICWYGVRVMTTHGTVSEYEAIFGHKERRRKVRRE